MSRKRNIGVYLTLAFLLLTALAHAADITFYRLSIKESDVFASFSVVSYKRKDIIEAIKRGLEGKVYYTIEVVEGSSFSLLGSRTVLRVNIKRSVKYDYWNKAFLVREVQKDTLCYSENALFDLLFSVKNVRLGKVSRLMNKNYKLQVRAELKSLHLYFPMNYVFKYVIGIWDFDTGWEIGPPLTLK
jgi:hypothetical protein